MLPLAALVSNSFATPDAADSLSKMLKDVQELVDARAKAYNCSFSVALKSPLLDGGKVHVVAGGGAETSSKFAWGSITKMWTGASIMQLVSSGVLELDEPAAPHVDAQLAEMKKISFPGMESFSKLADLYGDEVNTVTIRNLLAMQSGIPDFDTANPSRVGPDTDPFRATVYANPKIDYFEPTLMSEPWVAKHKLTSKPGEGFHYSSTNFGLLGLILAHHAGIADIRHLNQSVFIPASLSKVNDEIGWAVTGSPVEHGVVVGYDRTDYNGQDPKKNPAGVDVSKVNGVFAGFTASDFVGPTSAVAEARRAGSKRDWTGSGRDPDEIRTGSEQDSNGITDHTRVAGTSPSRIPHPITDPTRVAARVCSMGIDEPSHARQVP
jgi:hypothetical protein